MSTLQIAVSLQLAIMVIGSIALNLHWFVLMLNTALRAMKRIGGVEEKKPDIEKQKMIQMD